MSAEPMIVTVCSTKGGTGKTTITANLGGLLADHGKKVLLVDGLENLNLHLASRNRPDVKMLDAGSLNAYEVLNHRWIVASEPAVRSLAEVLS